MWYQPVGTSWTISKYLSGRRQSSFIWKNLIFWSLKSARPEMRICFKTLWWDRLRRRHQGCRSSSREVEASQSNGTKNNLTTGRSPALTSPFWKKPQMWVVLMWRRPQRPCRLWRGAPRLCLHYSQLKAAARSGCLWWASQTSVYRVSSIPSLYLIYAGFRHHIMPICA